MRDVFYGYHPLSSAELEHLWREATIVLDTNALLNLYRYSPASRKQMMEALESVRERLWMPFQVGLEFHRHRLEIVAEQLGIVDAITNEIIGFDAHIGGRIGQFRRNAFLSVDEILEPVSDALEAAKATIEKKRSEAEEAYGITVHNDPILEQLAALYADRVGSPYSDSELVQVKQIAEERYQAQIPPGYMDANKPEDRKYGDYIIWRQILDHARQDSRAVLLITDDNKEDWWWYVKAESIGRQRLGPRAELRGEFKTETSALFYAYSSDEFLSDPNRKPKSAVPAEVVNEVRETSAETRRGWRTEPNPNEILEELRQLELRRNHLQSEMLLATHDVDRLRARSQRVSSYSHNSRKELESELALRSASVTQLTNQLRELMGNMGSSSKPGTAKDRLKEIKDTEDLLTLANDQRLRTMQELERLKDDTNRSREITIERDKVRRQLPIAEDTLDHITSEYRHTEGRIETLREILRSIAL